MTDLRGIGDIAMIRAMDIDIRAAVPGDAAVITDMALSLTGGIIERTGMKHFDLDRAGTAALCARLIESGDYLALLAVRGGRVIGYAGISESCALYAGGVFGTLQEFYVVPDYREAGVGGALLAAVREHARTGGWVRIELCTPPLPEFARTLTFYERHGFEVTGGRKMRAIL